MFRDLPGMLEENHRFWNQHHVSVSMLNVVKGCCRFFLDGGGCAKG